MRRVINSMGLGTTLGMPDNLSEAEAMWCLDFPFFCSAATVQASQALMTPGLVYAPVNPLPAPSAIPAGSVAALPSVSDAQDQTDAALAAANAQGQANFVDTINQTAANLAAIAGGGNNPTPSGIPSWLWWVLGGGLMLALVWTPSSGAPQRYGR